MSSVELLYKINNLDNDLKNETMDFIDFLLEKKQKRKQKKHPKAGFLKNTFIVKDGFDEIPDCFEEYIK